MGSHGGARVPAVVGERQGPHQRADAITVAAKKPFIVIDATDQSLGMPVFESEIAKSKIIVNGAGITTEASLEQAPYRWNAAQDNTAGVYIVGELIGKTLSKKKAQWAGSPDLQKQTRNFGIVYAQNGVDVDLFNKVVTQWGGTAPKVALSYDSTDSSKYEENSAHDDRPAEVVGREQHPGAVRRSRRWSPH